MARPPVPDRQLRYLPGEMCLMPRAARIPAERAMNDVFRLLIPLIGVSIPFVVVAGKFVVQPIVAALLRHAEVRNANHNLAPVEQRLAATEERLAQLERTFSHVLEEQEFQRNLLSTRSSTRGPDATS
jgi:hypothetical protein